MSIPLLYNSSPLTNEKKINVLIDVLLIHAFIVSISSFIPSIQEFLKPISGFGLIPISFRSSGLTNGYDFSGAICLIGLFVSLFAPHKKNRLFLVTIFGMGCLFTSRVTMVLFLILLIVYIFFGKNVKRITKIIALIVIMISFVPLLGIVLYSLGIRDNFVVETFMQNPTLKNISDKIVYYYSSSDVFETLSDHYNLSSLSNSEIVFGTLLDSEKDPGYVQYIQAVGVVGLTIAILVYFIIAKTVLSILLKKKKRTQLTSFLGKTVLFIVFLVLLLSFKNSYIFARHITEILIMVVSIFHASVREARGIGVF